MCSFGYVVIGKSILNEPRKLANFHVNPDIKIFASKLSKWYPDYVLVIFTTQIFVEKSNSPKYIIRPPLVIFSAFLKKNTSSSLIMYLGEFDFSTNMYVVKITST